MEGDEEAAHQVEPVPVKREVVEEDFLTEQDIESVDNYLSSYGGSELDDEWEAAAVVKHEVEEEATHQSRRHSKRATMPPEEKKRQQLTKRSRMRQEEDSDPDYDESPRRKTRSRAKKTPAVKVKAAPKSRNRNDSHDSSDTTPKKTISFHVPTSIPGKTRRKKVSEMTEEEREIAKTIWREQARERRKRQRLDKLELEDEEDWNEVDVKVEVDGDNPGKSGGGRSSGEGAKRPRKVREGEREKNRECMAQKRKNMTPEEKEEFLRKHRERTRERRAQKRASMTEQELEETKKREAEKKRLSRMKMTPEQKREMYQKEQMCKILKQASMTEEEIVMKRTQKYMNKVARLASLSKEEREEQQRKRQEYSKRKNEEKYSTEEERQRRRERLKAYRDNMTPEQKERFREKLKRGYRNRVARLMQDKGKWAEENERRKMSRKKWVDKVKSLRAGRERQRKSKKEKEAKPKKESGIKRKREPKKVASTPLTKEEKRERDRIYAREKYKRRRMKIKEMLEKGMDLEEIKNKIETPEQRQSRLILYRIKYRKYKLKKELEALGASEEEIAKRLKEVEATYNPELDTRPFRPFKPRKVLEEMGLGLDNKAPERPALPGPAKFKRGRTTKKQQRTPQVGGTTSQMCQPSSYTSGYSHHHDGASSSSASSYISPSYFQQGLLHQPQPSSSLHYHHHQQQNRHLLPHQLPQTPPLAFDYSLQHVLNGVAYQGPSTSINQHHSSQHQLNTPNHRPEYAPSYSNDSPPPPSPNGGDDDFGDDNDYFPDTLPQTSPPKPRKRLGTSPNKKPSTKKSNNKNGGSFNKNLSHPGPRGANKRASICPRDATCDECGYSYTRKYLTIHKNRFHNPNYKDQTCQICQKRFGKAQDWYHHYMVEHPVKEDPLTCDICNQSFKRKSNLVVHQSVRHGIGNGKRKYFTIPKDKLPCRSGVRGAIRKGVKRDAICDICGNAYHHKYLVLHKNRFHNPNYQNETCQICQEKFNDARDWYTHYLTSHVQTPITENSHICDICGKAYSQKTGLRLHKHYHHGEGSKKENFHRCPLCPGEKLFRRVGGLNEHLQIVHPDSGLYSYTNCYRCDEKYKTRKELAAHVERNHPDQYFNCQFGCDSFWFCRNGRDYHYEYCRRITKEELKRVVGTEGYQNLGQVMLDCEFCGNSLTMSGLSRHYNKVHGVKEDFRCREEGCRQGFRNRVFWAVHLEEKHRKEMKEVMKAVRKLNVASREGLEIKEEVSINYNANRNARRGRGKGRAKKRVEVKEEQLWSSGEESESDKEQVCWEELSEEETGRVMKRRRKILVIAEEDEVEAS